MSGTDLRRRQELLKAYKNLKTKEKSKSKIPRLTFGPGWPLSQGQMGIWFMEELHGSSAVYNIPWACEISGPLDEKVVKAVIEKLVQRHEALRSEFQVIKGVPHQMISENPTVNFEVVHLNDSPSIQKNVDFLLEQEFNQPIFLEKEATYRSKLYKLSDDKHILSFVIHHMVADAVSMNALAKDFLNIYQLIHNGLKPSADSVDIKYGDFVHWQNSPQQKLKQDQQLKFWQKTLGGYSGFLNLPTDFSRPAQRSFNGASIPLQFTPETSQKIFETAQLFNISPFIFLQSCFSIFLSQHTGQDDIVIGSPVSGRVDEDLHQLIGFFRE